MKKIATVTSKGQVTVPLAVRTRLGLREGDRLEFVSQGDEIILRPARREENPFAAYVGALPAFPEGLAGIHAWVSELRDDDDVAESVVRAPQPALK
jgi:antitoxin PrlF